MTNNEVFPDYLSDYFNRFPTLPKEAILKQDILSRGLSFSPDALSGLPPYKSKDYFIFSFDMAETSGMKHGEQFAAPEELRFSGGPWGLKKTVVSVRIKPDSPYRVQKDGNRIVLFADDFLLAELEYHPLPSYYQYKIVTASGLTPVSVIAPVIEWGYLIYLTVFRLCQYHNRRVPCLFCDMNHNFIQKKKEGRPLKAIRKPEEFCQALEYIVTGFPAAKALTITGGSVPGSLTGRTEAEFYADYARAIRERFPGRWLLKAVVQAMTESDCRLLFQSGINIYHPNYEVWDAGIFATLCPGKEKSIGRNRWIERILRATDIFGPEHVIPNFVAGVELNSFCGFNDVEEALGSTTEGLDFFMSRRILPRFTSWCPEPGAKLGKQATPSLYYYCRLMENYRELFRHYRLPPPPGYGPCGVGNAVFSVSPFMDIL